MRRTVQKYIRTTPLLPAQVFIWVILVSMPRETHAQTITDIIKEFTSAFEGFVAVVFGIAFVVFVWNVVQFVRKAGDDAEVSKARSGVLWATFGLFFIASIWGIVAIVRALTGVENITECQSPSVVVSGGSYELTTCE